MTQRQAEVIGNGLSELGERCFAGDFENEKEIIQAIGKLFGDNDPICNMDEEEAA